MTGVSGISLCVRLHVGSQPTGYDDREQYMVSWTMHCEYALPDYCNGGDDHHGPSTTCELLVKVYRL